MRATVGLGWTREAKEDTIYISSYNGMSTGSGAMRVRHHERKVS